MPRERLNLLAHDFVDLIFSLEELGQNPLGFAEGPALATEIRQITFLNPVNNQVGEMRDAGFGEPNHSMNPLLAAIFCLARVNILYESISRAA